MSLEEDALRYHAEPKPGKIAVQATKRLTSQRHLSLAYSPGVAEPCRAIAKNDEDVFKYTSKGNLVAVITDGSAVLGLGNIGPHAAKPVMEGKANLFKKFADIDVFDIELNVHGVEDIVAAVKAIAPTFGGINLEDIKSPECFEIERILSAELDIPVFHDDQHGTAIISGAALLNAAELTNRTMEDMKIVFSGAGAAAVACAKLYVSLGVKHENIVMCDIDGPLNLARADTIEPIKQEFITRRAVANMTEALIDADAFVGLSAGNVLNAEMLQGMAPNPIIFAMANPDPEIPYAEAKAARPDAIVATGRSDHPNQVNNVLGFPFVFRGALDCRARKINEEMKMAATQAIAQLAKEDVPDRVLRAYDVDSLTFGRDYLIPKPFDPRVLLYVAPAIAKAAAETGVARKPIADLEAYREELHLLVERSRGLMQPLVRRARLGDTKRIVFPDGTNPQILRAAQQLCDDDICQPVLVGLKYRIHTRAAEANIDISRFEIVEPTNGPEFDRLAEAVWKLRQRKGTTLDGARARLHEPVFYASMMVAEGMVDGMVGGLGRPYKSTLRPALRTVGTDANGTGVVSGVYAMLFRDRKLFFGDCTVNIDPDAEALAAIALNTAKVAETFGQRPRVAMLSFSDFGEMHAHPQVAKVRKAIEIVRKARPDLEIDGEMQADTAIDWEKMSKNFPFTTLSGPPNVLVFPNLTAANIAYKLLANLSDAEALGPLVVGLNAPVNVIPVHASVAEIVNVATYTVNQVLERCGK